MSVKWGAPASDSARGKSILKDAGSEIGAPKVVVGAVIHRGGRVKKDSKIANYL
jgi:hypothetical protein